MSEDVTVSVAELRKIAPDLAPSGVIVTASDAANVEEDARTLTTTELPSQARTTRTATAGPTR